MAKNVDNIAYIQEALMQEIIRLNDDNIMKNEEDSKAELLRATGITSTSMAFMKSVALKMAIVKAVNGSKKNEIELSKIVGVLSEK